AMENVESLVSDAAAAPPAAEYTPVTLTAKAVEMVKTTRQQEGIADSYGLRIAVRGGGCSGFEYALDFENEARSNDWLYDQAGMPIHVAPVSAGYAEGTSTAYAVGMRGGGSNYNTPTATGSARGGSSFAV